MGIFSFILSINSYYQHITQNNQYQIQRQRYKDIFNLYIFYNHFYFSVDHALAGLHPIGSCRGISPHASHRTEHEDLPIIGSLAFNSSIRS